MFRVFMTAYMFFKDDSGHTIDVYSKNVIDWLRVDDPMEVVQLFHMAPKDSVMSVYDDYDKSYRFGKGELANPKEDFDIDLFPWKYV